MTPKITLTNKSLSDIDKKYCRIELASDSVGKHRFVESTDGYTTYRMGIGNREDVTIRSFRTIIRSIIQAAKNHQIEYLAIEPSATTFPKLHTMSDEWVASTVVENILLASYEFTIYKSKTKEYTGIKEVLLVGEKNKGIETGTTRGRIVGDMVNAARNIANTHGDDLTPKVLADQAKALAKGTSISIKTLGRKEILKEKLNLLHAVGKGSHNEEQFIIMEYYGAGKGTTKKLSPKQQPLILIGKGITYDTGGLNVKSAGSMHDMHMDMSGGSSVMAAIVAAAKLGVKKNIIALIPSAENAISSHSMRAGDIVTAHNGTTVEILHTDAEGRLVLADALSYATRYQPRAIIDVATLTGAALVAVGQHTSVILTQNDELESTLRTIGEESGDLVWPLPLWDEYKQHIKSNRADIANIATNFARWGGCIEGGTFLSYFAPKNVPWAHLDIAPRMESIASDKLAKGSTGEPVRLLVQWLEQY